MLITEVRIKLMAETSRDKNERLHAFASITFENAFVVRDLKVIEGTRGLFVAMPSRKLTDRCTCGGKNPLRSRFCTHCGRPLDENRALRNADGRAKLHADIAHPINAACREIIQKAVLNEFLAEWERAKQPDYVSRYDEWEQYSDDDIPRTGVSSRLPATTANTNVRKESHLVPAADRPPPNHSHTFGNGIL